MLIPDKMIRELGESVVQPFDDAMVQPASIDVRLDRHFYTTREIDDNFGGWSHSPRSESFVEEFAKVDVPQGFSFTIYPGEFALASTYETVSIPNDLSARFEGKSSIARLGLFAHITAGFIDPGFKGHITLELYNAAPYALQLIPGMKIGQLCFFKMFDTVENPYGSSETGSHYQGQRGPTLSKIYENLHVTDIYKETDNV